MTILSPLPLQQTSYKTLDQKYTAHKHSIHC